MGICRFTENPMGGNKVEGILEEAGGFGCDINGRAEKTEIGLVAK